MKSQIRSQFTGARGAIVLLIGCLTAPMMANAAGLDDAKMGLRALAGGDFEQAVYFNTRAIDSGELEPESLAVAHYNRAKGLMRLNERMRAIEDFKKAYQAWPSHPLTQEKMREFGLLE